MDKQAPRGLSLEENAPKTWTSGFVIVELMQIRFLNGLHGSKVVANNVMKCAYPVYRGLFQITLKISF